MSKRKNKKKKESSFSFDKFIFPVIKNMDGFTEEERIQKKRIEKMKEAEILDKDFPVPESKGLDMAEFVAVQPMNLSTDLTFYMDFVHTKKRKNNKKSKRKKSL